MIILLFVCRPFFKCLVSSASKSKVSLTKENDADLDGRWSVCDGGAFVTVCGRNGMQHRARTARYWARTEHRTFESIDHLLTYLLTYLLHGAESFLSS